MAIERSAAVRELFELLDALDRLVPHLEQAGEAEIGRDAAVLKARALKHVQEIEAEHADAPQQSRAASL